MICGFFGVVIALERAVAIGRGWAYAGPLLAGSAAPRRSPVRRRSRPGSSWPAAVVLLAASIDVRRRQTALFTFTLGARRRLLDRSATSLWLAGLDRCTRSSPWWLAFLILTIAGERLELSRFLPPSPVARRVFAAILVVIVRRARRRALAVGRPLFAGGLLALALWLLKQDIARRTVRGKGLTRFIAVCLLSGYALARRWAARSCSAPAGWRPAPPAYDAALHALGAGIRLLDGLRPRADHLPRRAARRRALPPDVLRCRWRCCTRRSLLRFAGDAIGDFVWTRAGGLRQRAGAGGVHRRHRERGRPRPEESRGLNAGRRLARPVYAVSGRFRERSA